MRTSPRASPPPRPPCSFHIAPLPPSRIRSRDSLPATCPAQHPLPVPTPAAQTHRSPPKTPPSQQPTNSLVFSSSFPLLPKGTAKNTPRHLSRKDSSPSSRSNLPSPHKDRRGYPTPSKNILYSRAFSQSQTSSPNPRARFYPSHRPLRLRNVCPHARRADRHCCINPSLAERDSALPLRAVRGIRAVLAVHRNVHDRSARLRHRRAQLLEVRLLQRTKMRAPRFDFLDVEFRANVRRELFQLHLSAASLVRAPRDEVPEWVRRNRNSFARRRRKLQARSRIRRKHRLHSRGQLQPRS